MIMTVSSTFVFLLIFSSSFLVQTGNAAMDTNASTGNHHPYPNPHPHPEDPHPHHDQQQQQHQVSKSKTYELEVPECNNLEGTKKQFYEEIVVELAKKCNGTSDGKHFYGNFGETNVTEKGFCPITRKLMHLFSQLNRVVGDAQQYYSLFYAIIDDDQRVLREFYSEFMPQVINHVEGEVNKISSVEDLKREFQIKFDDLKDKMPLEKNVYSQELAYKLLWMGYRMNKGYQKRRLELAFQLFAANLVTYSLHLDPAEWTDAKEIKEKLLEMAINCAKAFKTTDEAKTKGTTGVTVV